MNKSIHSIKFPTSYINRRPVLLRYMSFFVSYSYTLPAEAIRRDKYLLCISFHFHPFVFYFFHIFQIYFSGISQLTSVFWVLIFDNAFFSDFLRKDKEENNWVFFHQEHGQVPQKQGAPRSKCFGFAHIFASLTKFIIISKKWWPQTLYVQYKQDNLDW